MMLPLIDLLERRRLFAAAAVLDAGTLHIHGTARNDTITVDVDSATNPQNMTVVINGGPVASFRLSDIYDVLVHGRRGADTINFNWTSDTILSRIYADAGNDTVTLVSGAASIFLGTGNDTLHSVTDRNRQIVYGEEGNDSLFTGRGNDLIDGGAGDDNIDASGGSDVVSGGPGNDTLGGDNNRVIEGSSYTPGNDKLFGGDGNDSLFGGGGNDQLHGDAGDDLLIGDFGRDTIDGGAGDDDIDGSEGNDTLTGGTGNDDTFLFDRNQQLTDQNSQDTGPNANTQGDTYTYGPDVIVP